MSAAELGFVLGVAVASAIWIPLWLLERRRNQRRARMQSRWPGR